MSLGSPLAFSPLKICVAESKEKGFGNCFPKPNLVGVTGLEPAAFCSQRTIFQFFPWFIRLFGAFSSENNAFLCRRIRIFRVVRNCKWSNVWSDMKSYNVRFTSEEQNAPAEVNFYCNYYTIQEEMFQEVSRIKNWYAVIKDYWGLMGDMIPKYHVKSFKVSNDTLKVDKRGNFGRCEKILKIRPCFNASIFISI